MRMNRVILVTIICTGILFSQLLSDKRPEWIEKLPDHRDLLQGVGYASDTGNPQQDQAQADKQAISQIIHEISTAVTSQLEDYYAEEQKGGKLTVNARFSSFTTQYAKSTVKGIKILERYHDKRQQAYYSYAVLSRAELERQFRESARQVVKMARDYHGYAQQALQRDDLYTALSNYSKALGELFIVQANIKERIEADLEQNGRSEMLQVRLENELSRLLGQVYFKTVSGNGQQGERNRGLPDPLIGEVSYRRETVSYPVKNLPVTAEFMNATGDLTENMVTDAQGRFSCYVNRINSAQAETGIITARIDFAELEPFRAEVPNLFKRLEQTHCQFNFQIDVAASVKMFVHILEEIDGELTPNQMVTPALIRQLIRNRYTVIDARRLPPDISLDNIEMAIQYGDDRSLVDELQEVVDYAIIGTLYSASGDVSSGVLYFANASADVKVLDLESGRIVGASVQEGIKGAGNDYPKAHQLARENCSKLVLDDILSGLEQALK